MKSKQKNVDKNKCFECYGSQSGCCANTGTVFRDKECKYYVDFFTDRQHKCRTYRTRNGDNN